MRWGVNSRESRYRAACAVRVFYNPATADVEHYESCPDAELDGAEQRIGT